MGCRRVPQTVFGGVLGWGTWHNMAVPGVTQGDGGPAKDVLAPAPRSRCIIDPSCSAEHRGAGEERRGGRRWPLLPGWGHPGSSRTPSPRTSRGTPSRGPTCHGVGDDGDEQALVPHLDAHVGVLHADDHPLHLPGKPLCSAPRRRLRAWTQPGSPRCDPGNPVTWAQPGSSCCDPGNPAT